MKKLIALFVVMLTVGSLMAAPVFSSEEFKAGVPVLMKGTLKVETWACEDDKICGLVKDKDKFEVYLSFCQPCIMCIPCTTLNDDYIDENGDFELSNVKMYIVEKISKDKKVRITEWDIGVLEPFIGVGKKGIDAKKGDVASDFPAASQDKFGVISPFYLVGGWNRKTWFKGQDEDTSQKVSAIIGVIQKLNGTVSAYNDDESSFTGGTLKLRRDDSFTKKLMLAMTDDSSGKKSTNPFLICDVPPELESCEDVMETGADNGYNMVQNYILKKVSKKYTVSGMSKAE